MMAVILLAAACTSQTDGTVPAPTEATSTSDPTGFGCTSAPESERHSSSSFALSISDNPIRKGEEVRLSFGSTVFGELPGGEDIIDRAITGYGSSWQCWNGRTWVSTHLVVHNGEPIVGRPGVTTTVPAVGMPVPNGYSIVIPDVKPGWYRIEAGVSVPGTGDSPEHLVGYVAVEVVSG